ncbi:MAG TPA: DUF4192 domain-containing protein [Terrimesophilobacter sp.]|uniref:DUF4192 domain-containing protein n=1 Tax=Terrimesophilobacter sp. TaxID=2906435 RepID=UPI002F938948
MTTTIRAKSPADLLATIPVLVGFVPTQSVVFLALRGPLQNAVLRVDLPDAASPAILKRFATQAIGMLCRITDVEAIVLAVHTEEHIAPGLPHAEFVDILLRRLRQAGFRVHDALCWAGNGWGSYLDSEVPSGGHPLSDLDESASRLPHALRPTPSEALIPDATSAARERMQRDLAHYRALVADLDDSDDDPPELEPLCDLPMFVEEALTWNIAERDAKGALLLFALQGPPVRDATMLQWAFGFELGDPLYDEAERFARDGLDLDNERSNMLGNLWMGIGPRPDQTRIERGIGLLLTLVSRAEPQERRAPLCMLAWLSWALGSGTRAGKFIDEARAIDAKYGMAELLDTMLSNGLLPEWVFTDPDEGGHAL